MSVSILLLMDRCVSKHNVLYGKEVIKIEILRDSWSRSVSSCGDSSWLLLVSYDSNDSSMTYKSLGSEI